VAALILETGEAFTPAERRLLERAARARPAWWYSSMSNDFARPTGAARQLGVLAMLFDRDPDDLAAAAGDPAALREIAASAGEGIAWRPGADFQADRLDHRVRKTRGIELSRRRYNRAWRFLARLEAKAARMEHEARKRDFTLAGRSGLAADITAEGFRRDPAAACFVAYFVARRNLRREFTLNGRANPMDEVADMLLRRLGNGSEWGMVARVHPAPEVVARLAPVEQGELLGRWWALMRGAAGVLRRVWDPSVDRTTMVVRRGMDSSTWNQMAQAYNTARAGWLNALAATGALGLLDAACPGKVMRLMAADLAYWHRSSGSGVDPDTAVWAALPLPWEVLSGEASCTRRYVVETCGRFGVNPVKRGWVAPRARGAVAKFAPTPELVHGVSIADPVWAGLLRRAGAFSGKGVRPGYADIAIPTGVVETGAS
jgi:hypothetical protein